MRYTDAAGNRPSFTAATQREALDELRRRQGAVASGTYLDPERGKISLATWRDTVLEGRNVEAATTAKGDAHWTKWVGPQWGHVSLTQLANAHEEIQSWVKRLETVNKLGYWSVFGIHNTLDQLLKKAVYAKRIGANPCDGIAIKPAPPRHPDEERPPSLEQFRDMFEYIPPGTYRRLADFTLETGLRFEEVVGLMPDCVDIKGEEIGVRRVVEEIGGRKRLREYPKSDASCRTIPLTRRALAVLEEQFAEFPPVDGQAVFRGPRGGFLGRNNYRGRVWVPAAQAAGLHRTTKRPSGLLEHWPHFHHLRHRFGSRLEDGGISRATIREIMGHKRPKADVTERYMHGAAERRRRAILAALGDVREENRRPARAGLRERRLKRRAVASSRSSQTHPPAQIGAQSRTELNRR